ncbi:MAG TPA: HisS family protein [Candidatus Paceibacterota bacterium]|nr:HisS family protein [Candidatus Paceibacterota bacterium]
MTAKKKADVPVLPEGYFDIIPDDQKFWRFVWKKANGLLADYSFERADLAPVELAETFTRPVASSEPDRMKKLAVARSHGAALALRADMAPSLMRVYLQYGMQALPHPVKLFANGPVVEPTERGTVMHYSLGVQTIGDETEAVDAELLFLGCRIMEALSLGSFTIRINTMGDALSKPVYARALRDFFKHNARKLSARTAAVAKDDPCAALTILATEDADLAKEAPQSVDHLSEPARLFFRRFLEFLDEGKVPYIIDHTLVTSDDFATHTIWEFVVDPIAAEGEIPAVPGLTVIRGGRMDRLAELLGGAKTASAGWTMDIDAVVARLKGRNANVPDVQAHAKVFLSQLGEAAKKRSLMLFEDIRKAGIDVRYSLSRDTIKGQLRMAARYNARFALIFGQKEALEGTVIVREMDTGIQETIPLEKIIDELKKRLKARP